MTRSHKCTLINGIDVAEYVKRDDVKEAIAESELGIFPSKMIKLGLSLTDWVAIWDFLEAEKSDVHDDTQP